MLPLNPNFPWHWNRFIESKKHLVITNDATRPTPTAQILKFLQEQTKFEFDILVATGSHKPPTKTELGNILGKFSETTSIEIHDCRAKNHLKYYGTTSSDNRVFLNRAISLYDGILIIGSVEPHYFAGFTGGRKAILPGIAGYSTIESNHRLALESGADPLTLVNNPVHEDMDEALDFIDLDKILSIQVLLDSNRTITGVFPGELRESFIKATEEARNIYTVSLKPADIIICSVHSPLDSDLYQAHKAIELAKTALLPNGIIILMAECQGGLGNPEFMNLLRAEKDNNIIRKIALKHYSLGYHKASKIADFATHHSIWVVSNLPQDAFINTPIVPFDSLENAFEKALVLKGESRQTLFIHDAGSIVPVIS